MTEAITYDRLYHLYINKGMSVRACADHFGIPTHGAILWRLHKWKIPTRVGKFQKGNKANPIFNGKPHPFLGRKHTKEARIKMSMSANGKVLSKSHRDNLSKAHRGLSKTKEWRRKIGLAHIGHTRNCGDKNPNWKGGIGIEPYCDAWADKEYKEDIKLRDNFSCQNPECWDTADRLAVHHIDYDKKNCAPENLITLCISCNARANFNRSYWQNLYEDVVAGRLTLINQKQQSAR